MMDNAVPPPDDSYEQIESYLDIVNADREYHRVMRSRNVDAEVHRVIREHMKRP